jgi:hypothetical protein
MLARLQRSLSWQRAMEISQWVIPCVSFYFIWAIIDSKSQNTSFMTVWKNVFASVDFLWFFSMMISLTFLNLLFESLKWKYVIWEMNPLSHQESFIQTLKAMAAGFITPFRSGALFARFVSNEKTDKMKILDATIRMAISQFTVTCSAGLLGLAYWFFINDETRFFILTLSAVPIIIAAGIYFYLRPLKLSFRNWEWKESLLDKNLVFLSSMRYLVFSLQYVLLLWIFGADIEFKLAFCLVTITFLVNTLLPTGILGKIGIRELSGILIIGETTGFMMEVSCAAFTIWILNQAMPAFFGTLFYLIGNPRAN